MACVNNTVSRVAAFMNMNDMCICLGYMKRYVYLGSLVCENTYFGQETRRRKRERERNMNSDTCSRKKERSYSVCVCTY